MKYAVISDVHLGQTNTDGSYSLLSNSASENEEYKNNVNKIRKELYEELKLFKGEDKLCLITLGDYLDLSMGNNSFAYKDHINLINYLPIDKLIIVVGNHDHHLWTQKQIQHRELNLLNNNITPLMGSVFDFFGNFNYSFPFVGDSNKIIHLYYPSLTLKINNINFYFTHGHLFGGLYTTISKLLDEYLKDVPLTEKLLASVNAPLIEAIYWLLGQVGSPIGTQGLVSAIYNSVLSGKTSLVNQLVDDSVELLLVDGLIKGIPDSWERWLVKKIVKSILKNVIHRAAAPTSKNRHEKNDSTLKSVVKWMEEVYKPKEPLVVVSGHTHKICDGELLNVDTPESIEVKYFNTGSWLVEPNHQNPLALMLKIDEDGSYSTKIFGLEK